MNKSKSKNLKVNIICINFTSSLIQNNCFSLPAESTERIREGLRHPGRGRAVRHQHFRHQEIGPQAQVAHVQAALQGVSSGKDHNQFQAKQVNIMIKFKINNRYISLQVQVVHGQAVVQVVRPGEDRIQVLVVRN
jgi:hypothetical protein